jgi:hypothetical protein
MALFDDLLTFGLPQEDVGSVKSNAMSMLGALLLAGSGLDEKGVLNAPQIFGEALAGAKGSADNEITRLIANLQRETQNRFTETQLGQADTRIEQEGERIDIAKENLSLDQFNSKFGAFIDKQQLELAKRNAAIQESIADSSNKLRAAQVEDINKGPAQVQIDTFRRNLAEADGSMIRELLEADKVTLDEDAEKNQFFKDNLLALPDDKISNAYEQVITRQIGGAMDQLVTSAGSIFNVNQREGEADLLGTAPGAFRSRLTPMGFDRDRTLLRETYESHRDRILQDLLIKKAEERGQFKDEPGFLSKVGIGGGRGSVGLEPGEILPLEIDLQGNREAALRMLTQEEILASETEARRLIESQFKIGPEASQLLTVPGEAFGELNQAALSAKLSSLVEENISVVAEQEGVSHAEAKAMMEKAITEAKAKAIPLETIIERMFGNS